MKKITILLLALALVLLLFTGHTGAPTNSLTQRVPAPTPVNAEPVTLTFVGDIMMDRGVKRSVVNNFNGDYNALFANTEYLEDADIAFGNLEGSVATGGHDVGSIYSFHMDPISLEALKNSGIDIVSFANNHVGDWSTVAFNESLEHLRDNAILYAGAGSDYRDATTPRIITVRGMKIGFLAATDVGPNWLAAKADSPGIVLANDPNLSTIISNAKKQVDILVVSMHWGVEYSPANAQQQTLAHEAIDAGADIVVGSHPHVMERVETYNGKPIFYSLGDFIFDQYFSPFTMEGMVATVSIDPQTKELTSIEKVSPLDKNFVPQALIPFDESQLVTKTFRP